MYYRISLSEILEIRILVISILYDHLLTDGIITVD